MTDGDGRPPALVEYLEAMRAAADRFSREEAVDGGRAACAAALLATNEYLHAVAGTEHLGKPLYRLVMALDDLEGGRQVPPMLEKPTASRSGRKAPSNNIHLQRGAIAGVLDALIASRLFDDNLRAAQWTARRVARLPSLTRSRAKSDAATVLKWREEASAGVEDEDLDKTAFVAFRGTILRFPKEQRLMVAGKVLETIPWSGHPAPRGNSGNLAE
jgi:hypothetical protein